MSQYVSTVMMLSAGGSILSFDKTFIVQLLIIWVNLIVLTVVLRFILYKPVMQYMTERTMRIKGEIDAARGEREEAMALKEQYEALIADIEIEREEILREAHKKAVTKSDQMLFDARHEAEITYHRALADLEAERKNIHDEMKRQMIDISTAIAAQFIEVSIDQVTQDRLIEQAMREWEGS